MTKDVATFFAEAVGALDRGDLDGLTGLLADGATVRIGSGHAPDKDASRQSIQQIVSGLCATCDPLAWRIARLAVGSDGWGAAVVAMSGVRRGDTQPIGDLTIRQRYAWVAHFGDVGIDHLHLHGVAQLDARPTLPSPCGVSAAPDTTGSLDAFLAAYSTGDVHGMTRVCTVDAQYRAPWELSGARSRRRAVGYVLTDGKPLWRGLFDSFEDLRIVTGQVIVSPNNAAVEIIMSGRQGQPWLRVPNLGGSFCTSGVLFFSFDAEGRINGVEEAIDGFLIESQLLVPRAVANEDTTPLVGASS